MENVIVKNVMKNIGMLRVYQNILKNMVSNYQKQNSFLQGNNSFKHNFNLDASQLFNFSSNTPINSIDNSIIYSKSPIPTNEFQKTGLLEKNKNCN